MVVRITEIYKCKNFGLSLKGFPGISEGLRVVGVLLVVFSRRYKESVSPPASPTRQILQLPGDNAPPPCMPWGCLHSVALSE